MQQKYKISLLISLILILFLLCFLSIYNFINKGDLRNYLTVKNDDKNKNNSVRVYIYDHKYVNDSDAPTTTYNFLFNKDSEKNYYSILSKYNKMFQFKNFNTLGYMITGIYIDTPNGIKKWNIQGVVWYWEIRIKNNNNISPFLGSIDKISSNYSSIYAYWSKYND